MKVCARIAVAVLLCLAACNEDAEGTAHDHPTDAEVAEFEGCPDTIPSFALGMSTASKDGSIQAALLQASPAPPARFFNDWQIAFKTADDAPAADVVLQRARAFMPVHGHYGTPDPRLTQHGADPSVFDVDKLNLFMRGPWQVILMLSTPQTGPTELIFEVCVEE